VIAADGNSITFAEKIYNNTGKELAAHQMVFAKPGFEVATVAPPPAARPVAQPGAGNTPDENAASAALAAGNDDEAIRLYSAAIMSGNPQVNLAYDYVARGIAYARKNQNDEAMKDFDAAIKLKPEDPEAHFRRGGILVGLKKYDDAIKDLDVAIKGDDMNATAYYLRGFSYLSLTQDVPGAADKDKACMLDMKYCM
jgi:tetratricopeptide (TPR) repeat protein